MTTKFGLKENMVQHSFKTPDIKICKLDEYAIEAITQVSVNTDWDHRRIAKWFNTKNPSLGNIRPITMLALGKGKKLVQIINNMLSGNYP